MGEGALAGLGRIGVLVGWGRGGLQVAQSAREYLGGSSERRESLGAWVKAKLIFMRTKRRKEQVIVPNIWMVEMNWGLCWRVFDDCA